MQLLTEAGSKNSRLTAISQSQVLLDAGTIVSPLVGSIENSGWKIGVIFSITSIRISVAISSLEVGIIPAINYEDNSSIRLSKSVVAKQASSRIGLEFLIDSGSIGVMELKNYGITYNLPVLGKFADQMKFLSRNGILSVQIVNLGYGYLSNSDYIDISIDYVISLTGFNSIENILVRFE